MTVWASTATKDSIDRAVTVACARAGVKPARKQVFSTAEQRALAVNLWRAGWPRKRIAHHVGFSVWAVSVWLRGEIGPDARFFLARNNRLAEMWRAGVKAADIGRELGMNATAVRSMAAILRKRGEDVPARPRGGRR